MRPVYMYLRSAAKARAGVSGREISVVPGWDSFKPPYSKALSVSQHQAMRKVKAHYFITDRQI